MSQPPTWRSAREALSVVLYRPHVIRTAATALIVGTLLFAINQLDVVLAGHATAGTWIKAAVTYLVPFAVANIGLLLGCRRRFTAGMHLHGGQVGAEMVLHAAAHRRSKLGSATLGNAGAAS